MASLYTLVLSALVFDTGFSHVLEFGENTELMWPPEYHFKGVKTGLLSGIIEPFEIWYSTEHNKSRIDYFNGAVKEYYIGGSEQEYGYMYKSFPVWTEKGKNEACCYRMRQDEEVSRFLPTTNYTYEGETTFSGRDVEIWKSSEIDEYNQRIDEIFYVYRDGSYHVPLRYERKKLIIAIGALVVHSVTLFQDFSSPDVSKLDVTKDKDCINPIESVNDFHNKLELLHPDISSHVDQAFDIYKKHHNKAYEVSEHELRKKIFRENWKKIQDHNKKNLSYKLGVNQFSDKTPGELGYLTATRFNEHMQGTETFQYTEEELEDIVKDLPENFDLRTEGFISKIKNQASCGSCWAFCTTAAVEGALTRNNGGRPLDLSEQSLVDCAWDYNNMGCDGGDLEGVFKYVLKHGIPTEQEYGLYMAQDGYCHIENMTDTYKIRGFGLVPPNSVNAMKLALYKYGPLSVGVHAGDSMMMYSSGIYYEPNCNHRPQNHGVVAVGYGVRDGVLYWIIKNSWGEQWGQDGYMLISATNNNCHVMTNAIYAVV
ncbi:pro-cathepsin H-like [Zerene cesonia]|uniref:pro-cathepsin H-like n=1 Tax=Zerene cesonia TaxID=33412 RepID=UPI0018E4F2C6|nr:pro-cathepsin H-like [Zerene cesonia]